MWNVRVILTTDIAGQIVVSDKTVQLQCDSTQPYVYGCNEAGYNGDTSFEPKHINIFAAPNGLILQNISQAFGTYEKVSYIGGSFTAYDKSIVRGLAIGYCTLDYVKDHDALILYYQNNPSTQINQFLIAQSPFTMGRQVLNPESTIISSIHATIYADQQSLYVSDGSIMKQSVNGTWIWLDNFELTNCNQCYYFRVGYNTFAYITYSKVEPKINFTPEPMLHHLQSGEMENYPPEQ